VPGSNADLRLSWLRHTGNPCSAFSTKVSGWSTNVSSAVRTTPRARPTGVPDEALVRARSRRPHARRSRVAVVMPTNTWQAYNFRDDDGDGIPNTWYANEAVTTVAP
jgi:hypothetical protein